MQLKKGNYDEIAGDIKSNNKKIIVYGAGMIGTILVPYLVEKYNLYTNLICYLDGDKRKQGEKIIIGDCSYEIKSPRLLGGLSQNTVILITNSNYHPIVDLLDGIDEIKDNEAYIIPILQVLNTHEKKEKIGLHKCEKQLIPKKIHYCWFSGNPLPEYLIRCIESWKKICPDYEIIRWDESNYDIEKSTYMKQAYQEKKWGFVPDVARLDILYNEGGIYLDTDVELIRNLDDLLYQEAFSGVEKWGNVNMGGCSGTVPHNPIIKDLLEFRRNELFVLKDGSLNQTTCGYYETKPLILKGMKPDNTIQEIENLTIYSSDFFHPYDYMSGETHVTENTFSIHHFNGGWLDKKSAAEREKTVSQYYQILKRMESD